VLVPRRAEVAGSPAGRHGSAAEAANDTRRTRLAVEDVDDGSDLLRGVSLEDGNQVETVGRAGIAGQLSLELLVAATRGTTVSQS
jgi:hypothetical protein